MEDTKHLHRAVHSGAEWPKISMPDQEDKDLEIKSCSKALPSARGQMDKVEVVLTSLLKILPLLLDSSFFLFIPPVIPL